MTRVISKCSFVLVVVLLLTSGASGQMSTEQFATGLSSPVYITAPPGDPERVFVLQQNGIIRIYKNGSLLATPFLNWTSSVNDQFDEQGLLGMAFHPDFDTNGLFYIYYTAGSFNGYSTVHRFSVSGNPDVADASSDQEIWRLTQPQPNHNGGNIDFGPDGYLYIGLGDGGGFDDLSNNAQNGLTQLGKMLRIDVDGDDFPGDPQQNYAIPASNPFVGNVSFLDEIWAYGLRNPYRWSFDRLTSDMYIGDVGQDDWEEVGFQPASSPGGENYGWRRMEGNHCFNPPSNCNPGSLVLPIHEYSHSQDGFSCSVIGGYVYRGSAIPSMQGHYFYADYCSDQIYTFRYDGVSVLERKNRTSELDPPVGNINDITCIGQDGMGELYIADRGGQIYKIVPDPTVVGVDPTIGGSAAIRLSAGRPNPFRQTTVFELALDQPADVTVEIYTAAGRRVRVVHEGRLAAGAVSIEWDGNDASGRNSPAGTYFVRARSGDVVASERITRLR